MITAIVVTVVDAQCTPAHTSIFQFLCGQFSLLSHLTSFYHW